MSATREFSLRYTEDEWEILEIMSQKKSNGKLSFRDHLNNGIYKLARYVGPVPLNTDPICIECKKKNTYLIPPETCAQMFFLSRKHSVPIASIVNRYLVNPLFNEYREREL